MKRFLSWCKKEIVLSIAFVLAIVSAFIIPPDRAYWGYIDFKTLAILFCLMAVMAGTQKIGVFGYIAEKLLNKVSNMRSLVLILVLLCFFSSMLITNDVALITFVPFTFIVLKMTLGDESWRLVVPIVVLQTIAANLGSMLTPIGNPQNLYLYGKVSMSFLEFMMLMMPYTVLSLVILVIGCLLLPYKGDKKLSLDGYASISLRSKKKELLIYGALFVLCVLTVAHVVPYMITLFVVLVLVFLLDREALKKVDYALLLTFVGFFLFIGNMGRIPAFYEFLEKIVQGNEVLTGVVASQFMSNVPAALLLSGFTRHYEGLIVGTNLGGLGTMIASMASLISFKYIGRDYKSQRGKYFLYFTVANLVFLGILLLYVSITD